MKRLLLGTLLAASLASGCHKHQYRPPEPCCPPGGGTLAVPPPGASIAPAPAPPGASIGAPTYPNSLGRY